jgi:hypothetical protein
MLQCNKDDLYAGCVVGVIIERNKKCGKPLKGLRAPSTPKEEDYK